MQNDGIKNQYCAGLVGRQRDEQLVLSKDCTCEVSR
jgi:hypothetical protein